MSEWSLYPPERVARDGQRAARCALATALCALAGVALCALGLALRWGWLCCAALVAGAWAAYYVADAALRPAREAAAFSQRMAGGTARTFSVRWRVEPPETAYVEGVRALAVPCDSAEGRRTFYIRDGEALPPVQPGEAVCIEAVDRFVVRLRAEGNRDGARSV